MSVYCEICGKKLSSIAECHFDHIEPYAKGGKSTAENCQILCISCNLSKTDKEMKDFLLEEKARRFFAGEPIDVLVYDAPARSFCVHGHPMAPTFATVPFLRENVK